MQLNKTTSTTTTTKACVDLELVSTRDLFFPLNHNENSWRWLTKNQPQHDLPIGHERMATENRARKNKSTYIHIQAWTNPSFIIYLGIGTYINKKYVLVSCSVQLVPENIKLFQKLNCNFIWSILMKMLFLKKTFWN